MDAVITIAIPCRKCHGRRYVSGLLCESCNGNGAVPAAVHRQSDPRRIALRNLTIAVLVLAAIAGAVAVFVP